jgi:hypothetical protein
MRGGTSSLPTSHSRPLPPARDEHPTLPMRVNRRMGATDAKALRRDEGSNFAPCSHEFARVLAQVYEAQHEDGSQS